MYLPDSVQKTLRRIGKITENEAACSFIKTQMHATISDINFTRDKEKIRKLKISQQ